MPTIKDLAKELNLSPSTISRALADHPKISQATKKLVSEKANDMGFRLNAIASSFRSKRTKSIGIIVPRIDIDFHSRVISGIEEYAHKSGYHVIIFQSKDSYQLEKQIIQNLQNMLVEGMIICLAMETANFEHLKTLIRTKLPIVFYDRSPETFNVNKVTIDDFESAFNATEHLIRMGSKNIVHIAGNQSTDIFRARLEGYKAALRSHSLPVQEDHIFITDKLTYQEGLACTAELLLLNPLPDGVFCANDYTAASVVQTLNKRNIKIPDQIAVVGFSNYPIAQIIEPNLTTVNDRAIQMGEAAAKMLIQHIQDNDFDIIDHQVVTIKTELIVRASSARR